MEERRNSKPMTKDQSHNLIMENRQKISVSGVQDVESFDEENIVLYTSMGRLSIKGDNLHINKLSVESGEVTVEGSVDSCLYSDGEGKRQSGGFLKRMFQ